MLVTSIFYFSHNVFYPSQNKFQLFSNIYFSSASVFNSDLSENLSFGKEFISFYLFLVLFIFVQVGFEMGVTYKSFLSSSSTLSQTSPCFYVSAVQIFLKTLWEKEKLLVTSNFSFFPRVYYPFEDLSAIFMKLKIVVCKLFQKSINFVVWERVNTVHIPCCFQIIPSPLRFNLFMG